jgi:hypothetical protein
VLHDEKQNRHRGANLGLELAGFQLHYNTQTFKGIQITRKFFVIEQDLKIIAVAVQRVAKASEYIKN